MTFLIVSVVISNLIAYLIPKRMTKMEMYTTCLFGSTFELIVDVYLDLKYDLYGYFSHGVDWLSLFPIIGLYPALNIIFLNYFPFKKAKERKVFYILGWTAFSVCFEWASVKAGYFYHNGWNYWLSTLAYPIILVILVWNLSLIRKLK